MQASMRASIEKKNVAIAAVCFPLAIATFFFTQSLIALECITKNVETFTSTTDFQPENEICICSFSLP